MGCQGRLSASSTNPFPADQAINTLYLVPCKGNQVSFYTPGFGWNTYPISTGANVPTLNLNSLNTAKCYDVFAYWDGSYVQLTSLAWSSLTARATSLTFQDGVYTLSTDQSRLYLGTFSPASASQVNDQVAERGLWNYFNRVQKAVKLFDTTASWSYNNATWRVENAAATKILVTKGVAEDTDTFEVNCPVVTASSIYAALGIGVDANNANSADIISGPGGTTNRNIAMANLKTALAAGNHSLYWLESTIGGSVTFYGQPTAGQSQSGFTGMVWC